MDLHGAVCMAAVLTSHNIQKNCNIAIFYLHPCTLGFFSFDGLRRCSLYGKEWWAATSIGLWMGLHGAMCMAAVLTSHNIQKNCNIAIFYLHPCTLGFFSFDGLQRCSLYGKEWWAVTSNGLWMDLHGAMCMAAVLTSHNIQKNCNIAIFYLHPCTLGFFSFDGLRRCSLYGKEWWAVTSNGLWMGLHGAVCIAAVLTSHNIRKNCNIAIFYLHPCTLGFFSFDGLRRCSLYGKEWWAATSIGLWMDLHAAMCMAAVLTSHNIQKNCNIAIFYLHPGTLGFFSFDGLQRCSLYGKEWWAATSIGLWMGLHGAVCTWLLCSHLITFRKIATSRFFICTLAHWDFFHLMGCEDVLCMEKSDELRLPMGYEWICMVPCAWLLCLHPITFRKIATSRFFICTLAHWDFFHLMGCEDVFCMEKSDELRLPLGYEWICMAPCAWLLCLHPITFRKIATSRFFICTLAHWDFFHLMGCKDVLCMEKSDELRLPMGYEWICMAPCTWLLCLHPITFGKIATSRFFICTLAHWDFFIWWAAKMFFVWKRVMSCDFHWIMNGFAWCRVHGCCAHIP